jgi:hypothetical protein
MSLLALLANLPTPVLLALIGCVFVFLLLLLLLIVFVPLAAERISCVMDILLRPYYAKKRIKLTIVLKNAHQELASKEKSK